MDSAPTPIRIPIRQAAKIVHKSRHYVRQLVEQGEVTANIIGGRPNAPWLAVDVDELRRAINRVSVYVPESMMGKTPLRRPGRTNPAMRRLFEKTRTIP